MTCPGAYSRVGSDLDRAYASPHVEVGFAPVAGDPIAALLREWVRFERSRGLTLSDVTAVAARDGHVMSLLGSDGTTLSPLVPARAIENVPSDRSYCIRPGGRSVSFVNTCDEPLWVLICPSDSVMPAPVPEFGTPGDACRLRAPAMQPQGPGVVPSFRVQAAMPFGVQFRQGEPIAPAGDALPLIVAACLDVTGPFEDVVPQFVSRPQTATDAFTFACRRIIN